MEPIYVLTRSVVIPFMHLWFRWHIEGLNNIPSSGPALIVSNHVAYLDPLAIGYAVDRANRRPRFLSKAELFEDKRIGWALRGCGQIEVRRGTPSAPESLGPALDALRRGEVVVVFPEGTVTPSPDLEPGPAKTGASRLALMSDAPVIPCAVWGTFNVWPKGEYARNWRLGQEMAMRFGAPLELSVDKESPTAWREATAQIMDEIARLTASIKPLVADRRRRRTAA